VRRKTKTREEKQKRTPPTMGRGSRRNKRKLQEPETPTVRVESCWWSADNDDEKKAKQPALPPAWTANDLPDHEQLEPLWLALQQRHEWKEPTLVQLHLWPLLLSKANNTCVMALAPTGSGKTYGYLLPLIALRQNSLVIVPTRELAIQVAKDANRLIAAAKLKVRVVAAYGGVDKQEQLDGLVLERSADEPLIVAGTPGRLLDVLSDPQFQTSSIQAVVLDEADRLACQTDLCQQVESLLAMFPSRTKTCLCSATLPSKAQPKWQEWLGKSSCPMVRVDGIAMVQRGGEPYSATDGDALPITDNNAGDWLSQIPSNLTQILHVCSEHKKPKKLMATLSKAQESSNTRNRQLGIIFFNTIKSLLLTSSLLKKQGTNCATLHSQMQQNAREEAVRCFQSGKIPLLLATDIAARGIHVENIRFVINYDFPGNISQYVHRCGRAARGSDQTASIYSFFTRNLRPLAADMVRLLQARNQWVDPNLQELVDGKEKKNRKKELRVHKDSAIQQDSDEDAFPHISSRRIVLKRAGNISDASDDDEDKEEC
jgi:ATP-dependent RNA helicase DDX5/DBP2